MQGRRGRDWGRRPIGCRQGIIESVGEGRGQRPAGLLAFRQPDEAGSPKKSPSTRQGKSNPGQIPGPLAPLSTTIRAPILGTAFWARETQIRPAPSPTEALHDSAHALWACSPPQSDLSASKDSRMPFFVCTQLNNKPAQGNAGA